MPNLSFLSLLQQCKRAAPLKQIHARTITNGHYCFAFVASKILASALSQNGDMSYAEAIFHGIPLPNIFDFNSMIMGFSQNSLPQKGISLFPRMRGVGVEPNHRTFSGLVKCCVCLPLLDQVHGLVWRFGHVFDAHVSSCLVTMYSRFGGIELARRVFDECRHKNVVCWTSLVSAYSSNGMVGEARKVFDSMPERNEVSSSAMVSGYVQNGCFKEAVELFRELRSGGELKFNGSLLVGVLNACAAIGALDEGKCAHRYVVLNGCEGEIETGTTLIDFYAKCGCIEDAIEIFRNMVNKDVTTWSAMVLGLSMNGRNDMALDIFAEMEETGLKPNAVTLVAVLAACNHERLVSEAWRLFGRMSKVYGIAPRIEHYGCMVDLLARAGLVREAKLLINLMPMEPDGALWCSLLNGCLVHGHAQLGMRVGRLLIQLEPQNSGWYILLSNMYAAWGSWDELISLRETMKHKAVVTNSAWSFIEVDRIVHKFLVNDKAHLFVSGIYKVLNQLSKPLDCYFLENE